MPLRMFVVGSWELQPSYYREALNMVDREGESAHGVHPSAARCPELTELSSADEVAEMLQLAAGGFPDDGERHRGPLQCVLASASVLARNDFPYYGGGDPPLIEREYSLRAPRRAGRPGHPARSLCWRLGPGRR